MEEKKEPQQRLSTAGRKRKLSSSKDGTAERARLKKEARREKRRKLMERQEELKREIEEEVISLERCRLCQVPKIDAEELFNGLPEDDEERITFSLENRCKLGCYLCIECWHEVWNDLYGRTSLVYCYECTDAILPDETYQICADCNPRVLSTRPSCNYPFSLASMRCLCSMDDEEEWVCPPCAVIRRRRENESRAHLVLLNWRSTQNQVTAAQTARVTEEREPKEDNFHFSCLPKEILAQIFIYLLEDEEDD